VESTRIILAALWAALMLTYLLGDVLRIFSGAFVAGEIAGRSATEWMWLLAALVMLIPILMIVASLALPYPAIKWLSIVAAGFLVLFNLAGLPYQHLFDNFLIVFGFGFNGLIAWYAWTWPT
jgi:Family of unknown function (DUF6326)